VNAPHAIPDEQRLWGAAALAAITLHAGAIAAVVAVKAATPAAQSDPVMVLELPPPGPAEQAASPAITQPAEPVREIAPMSRPLPDHVPPEIDVPASPAPLPPEAVTVPRPSEIPSPVAQPQRRVSAAPPPAATRAPQASGAGKAPGSDPRAQKKAADYYSLLMAHLQRKKRYPADAKKARQQGIVTVRFSIDRGGNVTSSSVKKSSGHSLLDQATLDLMQRVSPLPPIPREMGRDSLTIALPIDYALRSK